jgi:hypothetical protein
VVVVARCTATGMKELGGGGSESTMEIARAVA